MSNNNNRLLEYKFDILAEKLKKLDTEKLTHTSEYKISLKDIEKITNKLRNLYPKDNPQFLHWHLKLRLIRKRIKEVEQ